MLTKSRIIVLHTIKHSDSGMVVQCYCDQKGRTACYFFAKGKHSRSALMFPLSILDVVLYSRHKEGGSMPLIREVSPVASLSSLKTDLRKNAISLFMCELLMKTVREGGEDPSLFSFLQSSIMVMDAMEDGFENFHLHFVVNLCKILGYMPEDNYNADFRWFDFTKGIFTRDYNEATCFGQEDSYLMHRILSTPLSALPEIKCSGQTRNRFLGRVMEYLSFHSSLKTELKSLAVLREIFS